jgi:hypothetical protein
MQPLDASSLANKVDLYHLTALGLVETVIYSS